MVSHAEAKPAPDFRRFDLDDIIQAALYPWNPSVMEQAANSLRCIEAAHGGLGQGGEGRYLVPDRLFSAGASRAAMLQAAQTTTATAAGLVDEALQPDFIAFLVGGGEVLPYLAVRSGLNSPIAVPRAAATVGAQPASEGQAGADTVSFTFDRVELSHKLLRAAWDYTPELNLSARRRINVEGVEEARRQFAHQIETQLWTGTGMDGQVMGLEARLTADRQITYPRGAWTRDYAWALMDAFNGNLLDRMGRVFVATRQMSKDLVTVGWDTGERRMWTVPLVDTVRPSEDGADPDVTGRLWLLQGRDIIVGLYGDDMEVIVDRDQKTGNHQVTCIRQWDLNLRHLTSHQVLVAAQ